MRLYVDEVNMSDPTAGGTAGNVGASEKLRGTHNFPFVQGVKIAPWEGIASTQGVSALINLRVNVAKFCCLLRAEANSHYARHCVQRYGGSCLLVQHCFGFDHKTL